MEQVQESILTKTEIELLIQSKVNEGLSRVSASKLVKKELEIIEKNSKD